MSLSLLLLCASLTGCQKTTSTSPSTSSSPLTSPSASVSPSTVSSNSPSASAPSASTSTEPEEDDLTGTGVKTDPYIIYTVKGLKEVADLVNNATAAATATTYYVLGNDIDMAGEEMAPIGTIDRPFVGVFDGQGYAIKNYARKTFDKTLSYYGLFGVTSSSYIHDLSLTYDISMTAYGKGTKAIIGSVVGGGINTYLSGIHAEGSIAVMSLQNTSSSIVAGGIVGIDIAYNNTFVDLTDSTSKGDIVLNTENAADTFTFAGGIVGQASTNSGSGVLAINRVTYEGSIEAGSAVGGIAASTDYYVSVQEALASGDSLKATDTDGTYAGGIVGSAYYENLIATSFADYKTVSAAASTSTYKSYAGGVAGFAYSDGYAEYETTLGAGVVNSASTTAASALKGDKTGVNGTTITAIDADTFTKTVPLSKAWNVSGTALPTLAETSGEGKTVTATLKADYTGNTVADQTVSFTTADYDTTGIKAVLADSFARTGYSFFGFFYDAARTTQYRWYAPVLTDISLYAGWGDLTEIKGTYDYANTFGTKGTWVFTDTNFYWIYDMESFAYTYRYFNGTIILAGVTGKEAYDGSVFLRASDGTLSGVDVNESEYTYSATKATADYVLPDYTGKTFLGDFYLSTNGTNKVTLKADGNCATSYVSKTTSSTLDVTGGYRVNGTTMTISASPVVKGDFTYDATNDIFFSSAAIFTREAITATYATADKNTVVIYKTANHAYTILAGKTVSSFTGTLEDGKDIVIGSDTYTVSGTTLTKKDATVTSTIYIKGTFTLTINSDGTGIFNNGSDNAFTWTKSSDTVYALSQVGDWDGSNTITFATDGTVTLFLDDTADENDVTLTGFTLKPASTVTSKTYKSSSNILLVIKSDGTGTYTDGTTSYSFTWTKTSDTVYTLSAIGDTWTDPNTVTFSADGSTATLFLNDPYDHNDTTLTLTLQA
jgi:uncharacterized protein YbjQ (UPF0145 family)